MVKTTVINLCFINYLLNAHKLHIKKILLTNWTVLFIMSSRFQVIFSFIFVSVLFFQSYLRTPEIQRNDSNKWVVIAFTDFSYLPISKLWYKQLTYLGYSNHFLVAIDYKAFTELTNENYRTVLAHRLYEQDQPFANLWKIRIEFIHSLLKNGKNVFLSDVDSIWATYRNLDMLEEMQNIDIFHGLGTVFPNTSFSKWGFVVCGCIAAFRSNKNVLDFFDVLVKDCTAECDDQRLINEVYLKKYKIKWEATLDAGSFLGTSTSYKNLSVGTFSKRDVVRDKNLTAIKNVCEDKSSWIVSPVAAKSVQEKLTRFKILKPCFGDHLTI